MLSVAISAVKALDSCQSWAKKKSGLGSRQGLAHQIDCMSGQLRHADTGLASGSALVIAI